VNWTPTCFTNPQGDVSVSSWRFSMRNICASMTVLLATLACGCTQHDTTVLKHKLDDAEITTAVKTKLATDEGLRTLTDIHVNSSNGVVTLAGEVPSSQESSKAERLAASVDGVAKGVRH